MCALVLAACSVEQPCNRSERFAASRLWPERKPSAVGVRDQALLHVCPSGPHKITRTLSLIEPIGQPMCRRGWIADPETFIQGREPNSSLLGGFVRESSAHSAIGHQKQWLNSANVVRKTTAGCMGLFSNPLPAVISDPQKVPSTRENWSTTDVRSLS